MRAPRILFVAMHDSIHVARWVELLKDSGFDLHLFPVRDAAINPNLQGVTLHWPVARQLPVGPGVEPRQALARSGMAGRLKRATKLLTSDPRRFMRRLVEGPPAPQADLADREEVLPPDLREIPAGVTLASFEPTLEEFGGEAAIAAGAVRLGESDINQSPRFGPGVLAAVVQRLQPDLIHSMEFQHAGYLTLAARDLSADGFPPWLATNWGSDIYHYRQFPDHAAQIRRLLRAVDLYSCECRRDLELAREFGFSGPELPMLTNTGGFDLDQVRSLRSPQPPSRRKVLMIKGYQHFAGRAMTSLRVLEKFAAQLKGFEVVLYSVSAEPRLKAMELRGRGLLNIRVIDWARHDEILALFGQARLYMGISLSDAISTSVLEAMAMGAFPIQTDTSCCDEWFEDAKGGFIVSPHDFEQICDRFHRALTDDALVDRAAEINWPVIVERLDADKLVPRMRTFYDDAFGHAGRRR